MIKIEKRSVEVDNEEFMKALIEYCELLKKHSPSTMGFSWVSINKEFKLKLGQTDFYRLSEKLDLPVHRGKFWYVDEVLKQKDKFCN